MPRSPEVRQWMERWMAWTEGKTRPQMWRETRRARAMAHRLPLPASWYWWAKVSYLTFKTTSLFGWDDEQQNETWEHWLHDIPAWAIPGYGTVLTEDLQDWFWMTWPVIREGAAWTCHTVREVEAVSREKLMEERWFVWLVRDDGPSRYLGTASSLPEARRLSGVEPGRIIPMSQLVEGWNGP